MTALVVIVAYLVIGCFSAIVVLVRQAPSGLGLGRGPTGLLVVLLWPFMLPLAFVPEAAVPVEAPARKSHRSARLDEVARRLEQGWAKAGHAAQATGGRERMVLEGFLSRLRASDRRLVELDEAIAQAPASVRERLQRLREATLAEIDQGISLLEELAAQLTLLRFCDLGEPSVAKVERDHIEDLLARIEALAEPPQNPSAAACS